MRSSPLDGEGGALPFPILIGGQEFAQVGAGYLGCQRLTQIAQLVLAGPFRSCRKPEVVTYAYSITGRA